MRRFTVLVVLAVALAGCGSAAGERSAQGRSDDAPFGTVDAVGGGQIAGEELAGRDLALWFWAPW